MAENYERFEDRTDTILDWVKKQKWSVVIVSAFWLSGYFAGHYVGYFFHWLGQLF